MQRVALSLSPQYECGSDSPSLATPPSTRHPLSAAFLYKSPSPGRPHSIVVARREFWTFGIAYRSVFASVCVKQLFLKKKKWHHRRRDLNSTPKQGRARPWYLEVLVGRASKPRNTSLKVCFLSLLPLIITIHICFVLKGGAEGGRRGRSSWGQKGIMRWVERAGWAPETSLVESVRRRKGFWLTSPSPGPRAKSNELSW